MPDGYRTVVKVIANERDQAGRITSYDVQVREDYIEFGKVIAQALVTGAAAVNAADQPA